MRLRLLLPLSATCAVLAQAQVPNSPPLNATLLRDLAGRVTAVTPKVVGWHRDLHAHPELSGVEERTAGVVAAHLRALGLEVRTNVAGAFGVIG
ncbi:MAG: amidohydrolase, partial [Gemmatimonadaceae bacterium]|nr:amidohydrolase [Gemmatimonadaceae bacterium]